MIRAGSAAIILVVVAASDASAADTEITAIFNQSVEANDNRRLLSGPKDNSYTSVSALVVDAVARTPTTAFAITGNIAYNAFGGDGEVTSQNTLDKGVRAQFERRNKLGKYHISGSWQQQDASTVQLMEDGFATLDGFVTTSSVAGGFQRKVTPVDTINWIVSGSSVDFSLPGGTPFVSASTNGIWTHQVNRRFDLVSSMGYQRFFYDDAANTEVDFLQAYGGFRSRLTPRLTVNGNVGVSLIKANNDGAGATAPSDPSIGLNADVQVVYKLLPNTLVSLSAGHSTAPNILGEFSERSSIGLALNHRINHRSGLLLYTQLQRSTPPDGSASDLVSAAATYTFDLTREWQSQISYIFRYRQTEFDNAHSNAIVFRVSRSATLLP